MNCTQGERGEELLDASGDPGGPELNPRLFLQTHLPRQLAISFPVPWVAAMVLRVSFML